MSKFNVGDRVRVKTTCSLQEYIGRTGIVSSCKDEEDIRVELSQSENIGVFQENLEPLGLPSFVWIKWSDHKLKAEDIKGRMVLEETISADLLVWKTYVIMHDCLRYMLIDPAPQEEELKEFDGVKPGIILQSSEGIRVEWSCLGING